MTNTGTDGLGSVCSSAYGLGEREELDYRRHSQGVRDEDGTEAVAELLLLCTRASKMTPPAEVSGV